MNLRLMLLWCIIVIGLCPGAGRAADTGGTAEPDPAEAPASRAGENILQMGELVVKAPRDERDLLETPTIESLSLEIASSIVDSETIRLMDADSLTDAIDLAPGVLTETRGRKEKSFSSIRGQIYPYPDYAINGVWQRAFRSIPSFFPAAAIERIEVLRSGGAIMVGPNSGLVGAVNLVTRRFDTATTILDVQGGSHDTMRMSLVHGDRRERGDYTIGAHTYSTRGPDDENAAENFSSLFGTGGWDVNDAVHMELTAYGLTGSRELRTIQDPGKNSLQNRKEKFSPMTSFGSIFRTLFKHQDRASTEIDVSYVDRRLDYHMEQPGQPDDDHSENDREQNLGVLHARSLTDTNTLRFGLQYHRWICPEGKRFFVGKKMDVDTYSIVVMDEQQWDRVTMDAGLRITRRWYRNYTDTSFNILGTRLTSREVTDKWGDPATTATVGVKYSLTNIASLYGHGAFGLVDPPPGAAAEDGGGMERESRVLLDAGIMLEKPSIGTFSAGLFTTIRREAVLLADTKVTEDGDTFNTYANDDVNQYGLELDARSALLAERWIVFANAVLMQSERRHDANWSKYDEIPNAIISAGFRFTKGRYDANLFAKYVSPFENLRFAQDNDYHDLGDFVDINLTAGVSFDDERRSRLYISLENLLDDEYSTVVGFPDYGFQAFLGFQYRW